MNKQLKDFIDDHWLDEIEAMNELQDARLVSDLCVSAQDVADADCERAILHLKMINKI